MKPGWQTTEFWVTAATNLWAMVEPGLPPLVRAVVPAVASIAYTLARAWVKRHALAAPSAPAAAVAVVEK